MIENRVSGHRFTVSGDEEFLLTSSLASDRILDPRQSLTGWELQRVRLLDPIHAVFEMKPQGSFAVSLHYQITGNVRRKWAEIKNIGNHDKLLLDVDVDDLVTDGDTYGGGPGEPVYVDDEMFAAIEHPAGRNDGTSGRIRLGHHPGRVVKPGETLTSFVSIFGAAPSGRANASFLAYIQSHSLRPKRDIGVYTPFGINNQWGAAASLDDEEALDVMSLLGSWKPKGPKFDYFTFDAGWMDPDSDLTRFRSAAFPNGPQAIIDRAGEVGLKLGLWFAMEWGTQSAWDYPGAYSGGVPATLPYREGYPLTAGGITFCLGESRTYAMLKAAVLFHVRNNHVRFLKFDGGVDECSDPTHDHLPGVYSLELKYDRLIDIAASARKVAPDVFGMWYWGLRSPFWALYGSTIFDSGYHLEGSGTSSIPTLFYRDSVTVAQDQAAQFAPNIPPVVKDSLGVWLAENRWGNFMGKERWREAAVMDLGRGNLLFPNLWGNLYSLDSDDTAFLARFQQIAKQSEELLSTPRHIIGNVWDGGPYGYAYGKRSHGLVVVANPSFEAHVVAVPIDEHIGLQGPRGTPLAVTSEFPARERQLRSDGSVYRMGDHAVIWLRPFETLMLEIKAPKRGGPNAVRSVGETQAEDLGRRLDLQRVASDPRLDVRFADEQQFRSRNLTEKTQTFETKLPKLTGPQPILAIVIRLRRGSEDWKYSPKPVEVVQAVAKVGDHKLELVPIPDGRQFGNTQHDGCSWIIYKIRLSPEWSHQGMTIAVHSFLPSDVEADVETWIIKRWWQQSHRPQADGYYTNAES